MGSVLFNVVSYIRVSYERGSLNLLQVCPGVLPMGSAFSLQAGMIAAIKGGAIVINDGTMSLVDSSCENDFITIGGKCGE